MVTSTISGEGKSVIAVNLARGIALKGYNTVLVDFDLRMPSIAEYIDVKENVNSVTDFIKGKADLKHCVYSTHSENLYIAVEKNKNPEASELVGSERAKAFIEQLSEIFDFVIIDSPPSGYIADSTVIGDYADATVYVIAQDVVSRKSIADSVSSFDNIHAKVIGAVLNRITKGIESISYGRYGYRKYGYSRYSRGGKNSKYGYGSNPSEKENPSPKPLNDNGVVFDEE